MSLQNIVLTRLLSQSEKQDLQTILQNINVEQLFLLKSVINDVIENLPKRTVEIVLNVRYGGFGLSKYAELQLKKLGMTNDEILDIKYRCTSRSDPRLIQVVREMGESANARFSDLSVITIQLSPFQTYRIRDNDGQEYIQKIWEK